MTNVRILTDLQDVSDNRIVTMEEGKSFLLNLWEEFHPEDWESEQEYDNHLETIANVTDWDDLDNRLMGCGYTLFNNLAELKEWSK